MGQRELGRYCKQKIGWLIPEVNTGPTPSRAATFAKKKKKTA